MSRVVLADSVTFDFVNSVIYTVYRGNLKLCIGRAPPSFYPMVSAESTLKSKRYRHEFVK